MKKHLFLMTLIATLISLTLCLFGCVNNEGDNGDPPSSDSQDPEIPGLTPDENPGPDVDGDWDPTETSATVLPAKGGASGIVVLIHDDGTWDTAVTLDGLYYEYGLVGDVALLTSRVWNHSDGTPKSADLNKWRELIATERWKIVSHSETHTWWGTAVHNADGSYTMTEDEDKMYAEIAGSQELFRTLFPGQRVLTFAYPGFTTEKNYVGMTAEKIFEIIYSEKARAMLEEHYVSSRAGLGFNTDLKDPEVQWILKYLNSPYGSDSVWDYYPAYGIGDSGVNGGKLLKAVTSCAEKGELAVMYMHKVVDTLTGGSNEMTTEAMRTLCEHIAEYVERGEIWNAHYEDAVLYVREANAATLTVEETESSVILTLTDDLDNEIYNYPLTVRSLIPEEWQAAKIVQGDSVTYVPAKTVNGWHLIDVDIIPDGGAATVTKAELSDVQPKEEEKLPPVGTDATFKVSYDFENGIGDVNVGTPEGSSAEAIDFDGRKVLHITKSKAAKFNSVVTLYGGNNAIVPDAVSLSFDIYINSASVAPMEGETRVTNFRSLQIALNADGNFSPYGPAVICGKDDGKLYFGELTESGGSNILSGEISTKKWYNIKIDICMDGENELTAVWYLDGEKIATSNNHYKYSTDGSVPYSVTGLTFNGQWRGLFDVYIDDATLVAGTFDEVGLEPIIPEKP